MIQESSGYSGTTSTVITAVTGIEIALWDPADKILDVPVYQLLGRQYRDSIRIYCDYHAGEFYLVESGYTDYGDTEVHAPETYAERAETSSIRGSQHSRS